MNNYINKKIIFIFLFTLFFAGQKVESATIVKPANNLGLVGYWSFNEGTSTVATDFSGRSNTGTLNSFSAPATASSGWGSGRLGPGLNFDGNNDYVSTADIDFTTGGWTLSAWIKTSNTSGITRILSKGLNDGSAQLWFLVRDTGILESGWYVNSPLEGVEAVSSISVNDGKWHHVVSVVTATEVQIYVDGVASGSPVSHDGTPVTNNLPWLVGSLNATDEFFNGSIDEVRMYSRELTANEIRNLYNSGQSRISSADAQKNVVTSGLIGYWTLDGGEMTTNQAYDRSSSANRLNLLNSPAKTTGKIGQGINLDAVDDELFCTDANCGGTTGGKMDMGTRDWTAMAWIKPEAGGTNCNIRGTVVGKIGDDEIGWYMGIGGQYICAEIRGASNISSTLDGSQVPLNEWSHIAVVFDRDGNMTRYLNGVQTGTQDNISANNGSSVDHPHNFCIGARDGVGGCTERLYDGSVDEVRVYERVLTLAEIKQIYNAGVGVRVNASQNFVSGSTLNSGLVGMWSFNGLDFTDRVYDRSGNGNDGYVYSGATTSIKTFGKIGQGLIFRNSTPYINLGSPASLDNLNQKTVVMWINRSVLHENQSIISKNDSGTVSGWGIEARGSVFNNGPNFIRYFHNWSGSSFEYAIWHGSTLLNATSTWYHIAIAYDRSSTSNAPIIYVNGSSDTVTTIQSASGTVKDDSSSPLLFGIEGSLSEFNNGALDEVRIYNRILTPAEVKQLYLIGR